MKNKDTSIKRFTLRLDAKIYAVVEKNAQKQKRSCAKEIEYVLETYYRTLKTA